MCGFPEWLAGRNIPITLKTPFSRRLTGVNERNGLITSTVLYWGSCFVCWVHSQFPLTHQTVMLITAIRRA